MRNKKDIFRTAMVLLLSAALFIGLFVVGHPKEAPKTGEAYTLYDRAKVLEILSDDCELDPNSDNSFRGQQSLLVEMRSGPYKGQQMWAENVVGPLYGSPVKAGDSIIILLSVYENDDVRASVYEPDRSLSLVILVVLFCLAVLAVGGKTGAKSLLGLGFTMAVILFLLFPLLMQGWPTIFTTFFLCAYVAVVCFVLLDGCSKKILCACLGTAAGLLSAMLFGLLAQSLTKVSGLRLPDVEPLLQLRQVGTPLGLRGLLVAGLLLSSLGAVMDVAMSEASALWEIHTVDPELGWKDLWKSGCNLGRDLVGTMSNTLILALLGGSFVLCLYLYTLGLSMHQLLSSAFLATEMVSALSSAVGLILSVPVTAFLSALLMGKRK